MRERNDGDPDGKSHLPGTGGSVAPTGPLAVSTGRAAVVDDASATLEGSLDELPGAGVAVGFEYRPVGADDWTTTATGTRSRPGTFGRRVEGLAPDTDYEFRARARAGDAVATGGVAGFATAHSPVPVVERYAVSGGGPPGDGDEVTVEWTVAGEGLATVLVRAVDGEGWVLDATRANVSGDAASGTDRLAVPDGGDVTVKLTVADGAGNTAVAAAAPNDHHE